MHFNLLTLKSLLVKSTPRTNGNTPVLAIVIVYFFVVLVLLVENFRAIANGKNLQSYGRQSHTQK